jgi:hypothetical protein
MKAFLIVLAITLITDHVASQTLVHRLIVQPSSTLNIEGTTNINSYECNIIRYVGNDTLVLHEGARNIRPVFVKGAVELDATSCDCGLTPMTSDFRKAINSKEYPSIIIDFISFERMPVYATAPDKFRGILKISIGGVTKLFEVNCAINATPSGIIHLVGNRTFNFSDFNMTPPTRMLGAVKVNQSLKVSFHLQLKLDQA